MGTTFHKCFHFPHVIGILQQVFDNIHMDPDTLLPRHWYLVEINPATLGGCSTANQRVWLASLESAQSVAELSRMGTLTETAKEYISVRG
jgi:hypothetical protein